MGKSIMRQGVVNFVGVLEFRVWGFHFGFSSFLPVSGAWAWGVRSCWDSQDGSFLFGFLFKARGLRIRFFGFPGYLRGQFGWAGSGLIFRHSISKTPL